MDLTLKELKPILKFMIENNKRLEDEGKNPIAINIVSEAGIGKSSIVEEIAKESDSNYIKLALAQITEIGDCVGFPIRLHYACKEDGSDCQWISPELIDSYVKAGYHLTSETKMSYALPEWYKNIDPDKPTILLLDDLTRALPNILQAIYELVYKQEMWSFRMPRNTTIIATSNPSDGDYNVNELDEAGNSRMTNFSIKWNVDSWAEWAETQQLDNRVINFMLSYHRELMDPKDTHTHIMNARSYTMFGNIISGINNWSSSNNLAMILQIASGCFNDKDNLIGSLFTTFIANKLDKLISPKDILLEDWDKINSKIESCVYDENDTYRPAVAAILQTRLLNYSDFYFTQKDCKTDVVVDRLLDIIHSKKKLFDEDILFNIIKSLCQKYPNRMNKYLLNPEIRQKVIG